MADIFIAKKAATPSAKWGGVQDLHPKDKARYVLAKWVLGVSAGLMLLAWMARYGATVWVPGPLCDTANDSVACAHAAAIVSNRIAATSEIFEFAKTWIPPIVTLVLGYYFASTEAQNSD